MLMKLIGHLVLAKTIKTGDVAKTVKKRSKNIKLNEAEAKMIKQKGK